MNPPGNIRLVFTTPKKIRKVQPGNCVIHCRKSQSKSAPCIKLCKWCGEPSLPSQRQSAGSIRFCTDEATCCTQSMLAPTRFSADKATCFTENMLFDGVNAACVTCACQCSPELEKDPKKLNLKFNSKLCYDVGVDADFICECKRSSKTDESCNIDWKKANKISCQEVGVNAIQCTITAETNTENNTEKDLPELLSRSTSTDNANIVDETPKVNNEDENEVELEDWPYPDEYEEPPPPAPRYSRAISLAQIKSSRLSRPKSTRESRLTPSRKGTILVTNIPEGGPHEDSAAVQSFQSRQSRAADLEASSFSNPPNRQSQRSFAAQYPSNPYSQGNISLVPDESSRPSTTIPRQSNVYTPDQGRQSRAANLEAASFSNPPYRQSQRSFAAQYPSNPYSQGNISLVPDESSPRPPSTTIPRQSNAYTPDQGRLSRKSLSSSPPSQKQSMRSTRSELHPINYS